MRATLSIALLLTSGWLVGTSQGAPPVNLPGASMGAQASAAARAGATPGAGAAQATLGAGASANAQLQRSGARPAAQNGTGRLGQAAIPGAALGRGHAAAQAGTLGRSNSSTITGQHTPPLPAQANARASAALAARGTHPVDARRQEFRTRLAQIDEFRDHALRRGDVRGLEEADRRERELRAHFGATQSTSGTATTELPTGPGYGRLTAQAAQEANRGRGRPAEQWTLPVEGQFSPGFGRLTAEQARALDRPPMPPADNSMPTNSSEPAAQPQ